MDQKAKQAAKALSSHLGKRVEDVLKAAGQEALLKQDEIGAKDLSELKSQVAAGDIAVTGGATLYGFVRGGITANIYFGSGPGSLTFNGSMWTSPIGVAGGGAGAWAEGSIPRNGQGMDFAWWGVSVEGGAVNVLWYVNGVIVGSLGIAVAGIAGGGGKGSGTWAQG